MLPLDKKIHLKGPVPIKIVDDNSLQGPIFHPGVPLNSSWKAGNNAASQYQGIQSVWKNMVGYFNKSQTEHGYDKKLQIKAGICEIKTLLDILPQMHKTIVSHPIYNKSGLKPYISITQSELDETGLFYKKVNIEKNKAINNIQKIRNNIGSHFSDAQIAKTIPCEKIDKRSSREKISWNEVILLWESLELNSFMDLITSIHAYLNFINILPIYEWYRYEENGTIRTHIPRTGTVDESGKEKICIMSESMRIALSLDSSE
ncbi:hypothetical protein AVA06_002632 [Salmonella enterica subsp. enterica]|nr:hypothetical protein [Salmonella enterica subsp. enterica]EDW9587305.1 hypothetical protein [Salmonella enterica subsp. enterica]EED9672613.1 hypothetical protein [Salmonella enterica subsp. enterica]